MRYYATLNGGMGEGDIQLRYEGMGEWGEGIFSCAMSEQNLLQSRLLCFINFVGDCLDTCTKNIQYT